jgi:Protein of unknown function (DUF4232)
MLRASWRLGAQARRAALLVLCLAWLTLAGCDYLGLTPGRAPSHSPTAAPSLTPRTSATPVILSGCATSQLAIIQNHTGLAMGHAAILFQLLNQSQKTCTLEGYPDVQLLDAHQHPVPTHLHQVTLAYTFSVPPPQQIVLAPGDSAYFQLEWTDVSPSGQGCPTNGSFMRITPPMNQSGIVVGGTVSACGGEVITSPFEAQGSPF